MHEKEPSKESQRNNWIEMMMRSLTKYVHCQTSLRRSEELQSRRETLAAIVPLHFGTKGFLALTAGSSEIDIDGETNLGKNLSGLKPVAPRIIQTDSSTAVSTFTGNMNGR